jgi:hypothetical protein
MNSSSNEFIPVNLFLLNDSAFKTTSFIDINQSFNSLKDTLRVALRTESVLILTNIPKSANSYKSYKTQLLYILNFIKTTLMFQNVYLHNDTYLQEFLNDIDDYKEYLKGVYVKSYGVCSNVPNVSLANLYGYKANITVLKKSTELLKPLELVVQTTASCEKLQNISNTFGSQLWLLDYLFQCSLGGVKSVVVESDDTNNHYAYDIFKEVTDQSKIVLSKLTNLQTFLNYSLYICSSYKQKTYVLINKSSNPITLPLEEKTYNTYSFTTKQVETSIDGMEYAQVTLDQLVAQPKSILVVKVPVSGGAYFENINNEDEKNTIITVRPYQLTDEYDAIPTTMSVHEFKKRFQPYM